MPTPVLSTYRLQLRGGFTFAEAEKIVDYLSDLGVSHLYLSPILASAPGSEHGYDVVDPTAVDEELGGADGLTALADAVRGRGMGLIVDIVPNHVGVGVPEANPWWWDVLRHGRDSAFATFFDIDWSADADGRILLPILGSDDDLAALTVEGDVLRVHAMRFPIAPGTGGGDGTAVHDRQHYRLTGWRNGVSGYRRFFAITSMAGLRQEDSAVFAQSHAEISRWFDEGLVDGVRIDHPDGLTEPAGYLKRLRELLGPQAWIVIEKILSPGEPLDTSLPIQGTTGYDVLRDIGGVFVDPSGSATLSALVESAGFDADVPALLRQLKTRALTETLSGELARLCRTVESAVGCSEARLPEAVAAVLPEVGVYRCDYLPLSEILAAAISDAVTRQPEIAGAIGVLTTGLTVSEEAAARFQQLCGAMTAKAVEDCYYYRDPRLVSLNEVGGDPRRFGVSAAEFHRSCSVRAQLWPDTMNTLSTHDTKRGEDVRARIGVLSQVPALWAEMVGRWESLAPSPEKMTGLFLWQNVFGVWPAHGLVDEELRGRVHGYAEKAIREAGLHTSWNDPQASFEQSVHAWLDAVLDGPVAAELTELVVQLEPHAHNDALGQKLLALTVPGVPDVYQGTELWEDSLVDPDNRRPVDYAVRRAALHRLDHAKMRVVTAALHARRDPPETFLRGGYRPVLGRGPSADHLLAFARGSDVIVAACRWTVRLDGKGWRGTVLPLPEGVWVDRITGTRHTGSPEITEVLDELPVALLERADG